MIALKTCPQSECTPGLVQIHAEGVKGRQLEAVHLSDPTLNSVWQYGRDKAVAEAAHNPGLRMMAPYVGSYIQ